MKPRIRIHRGIWHCFLLSDMSRVGEGYTPGDAYEDWKRGRNE